VQAASGIEAARQLFVQVDAAIETRPAIAAPAPSDGDDLRTCMQQLMAESAQVQRSVGAKYRLTEDDAHDIVRDALVRVCVGHSGKRYTRLGAVLQIAAERRAITWAWRRRRQCELDVSLPACSPGADELVRFPQEDALLDSALCEEDQATQTIIWLRVQEGLTFADVGARLGIPEDAARYKFNNALRRMRKRLADACDL
jgi:DNA-directed RNA polymerase specialized sigma24 family protein